jgi:hypothetical protein
MIACLVVLLGTIGFGLLGNKTAGWLYDTNIRHIPGWCASLLRWAGWLDKIWVWVCHRVYIWNGT